MAGRVCAITGASSGLGYETALARAREGATVALLCRSGPISASARRGARTQVWLAASPAVEGVSGCYFARCRARRSARISYDRDAQRRLWEASEMLLSPSGDAAGSTA